MVIQKTFGISEEISDHFYAIYNSINMLLNPHTHSAAKVDEIVFRKLHGFSSNS